MWQEAAPLTWYWLWDKRSYRYLLHDTSFVTWSHTAYTVLDIDMRSQPLHDIGYMTWSLPIHDIGFVTWGPIPYITLVHAPYISEMSPHPLHTWYWLCDMGPHPLHDTGNVALGYTTLAILHEVTTLSCNVSLMWHWHWTQVHSPYISDMSPHPYTHDVGYVTWDHTPLRILACDMSSHPLHK